MRLRSICVGLICAVIAAGAVAAESPVPEVLTWVYNCQSGGSFGAAFVVGGQEATLFLPAAGHSAHAADERTWSALWRQDLRAIH